MCLEGGEDGKHWREALVAPVSTLSLFPLCPHTLLLQTQRRHRFRPAGCPEALAISILELPLSQTVSGNH